MRDTVSVLQIPVDCISMPASLEQCRRFIEGNQPAMIATVNAEMIMMARRDPALAAILQKADLSVPDGVGVVWAARYHGARMPERVAGYDLVQNLLKLAAQKEYRVYFLGGSPGIAEKAKARAEAVFPGLQVAGVRDGYYSAAEEPEVLSAIRAAAPHILLVALGAGKQEKWIVRHREHLAVPLSIGVGGTFDVMAGTVKRAPLWMQKTGLEWLFRLLSQPRRAVRMLALPRFVLAVVQDKNH